VAEVMVVIVVEAMVRLETILWVVAVVAVVQVR
jgi:hypothetical protein